MTSSHLCPFCYTVTLNSVDVSRERHGCAMSCALCKGEWLEIWQDGDLVLVKRTKEPELTPIEILDAGLDLVDG